MSGLKRQIRSQNSDIILGLRSILDGGHQVDGDVSPNTENQNPNIQYGHVKSPSAGSPISTG